MAMKDAGLRIRIDRNLRERFLEVCRTQDKPAAQVIREFMREYIQTHDPANDLAGGGNTAESKKAKG
jgi:predicted DNA-binding protein